MNLKSQLKYFLQLRELSAAELARRTGVSKQTISQWLMGTTPRDVFKLKRVATVLETSVDNLIFGQGLGDRDNRAWELQHLLENGQSIRGLFDVQIRLVKRK